MRLASETSPDPYKLRQMNGGSSCRCGQASRSLWTHSEAVRRYIEEADRWTENVTRGIGL